VRPFQTLEKLRKEGIEDLRNMIPNIRLPAARSCVSGGSSPPWMIGMRLMVRETIAVDTRARLAISGVPSWPELHRIETKKS
jgi:hypothetical protein